MMAIDKQNVFSALNQRGEEYQRNGRHRKKYEYEFFGSALHIAKLCFAYDAEIMGR